VGSAILKREIIAIFLLSLFLHILPAFFLPPIPLYDTDSWYTVRQIQLINTNQPLSFDPLLNPPDGKQIDWGVLTAYIYAPFAFDSKIPIDIFNRVAWVSPLLVSLFCVALYFVVGKIWNEQTGMITTILVAVSSGFFYSNGMYGIIDHHLLETILGTLFILFLVGRMWAHAGVCILLAWFNSPLSLIYVVIGMVLLVIIVAMSKGTTRIVMGSVIAIGSVVLLISPYNKLITERIYLLSLTTPIPIYELYPLPLKSAVYIYNILIIVMVIGVPLTLWKYRDNKTVLVLVSVTVLTVLTLMFRRFEVLLTPLLCVLCGVILSTTFVRYWKPIVAIFIAVSLVSTAGIVSGVVATANQNVGISNELVWLSSQPPGIVLSEWDYGFWILNIGNKIPFSDPFQIHEAESKMLLSSMNATDLRKYNISYVLTSEKKIMVVDYLRPEPLTPATPSNI
jgi:asparagine N-glycosylation enzyme membrane subunit Stt3